MSANAPISAPRMRLASPPLARLASWFVVLTAFALIGVALGSYFYHRRQLDTIAASYLRLVVAGSGEVPAGSPSTYNLLATTVTGEPCTAQVEWSLATSDGRRLVDRKEPTDEHGLLTMTVPADMDIPTRSHGPLRLNITAGGTSLPSASLPLLIRPKSYLTRLWLDRRNYRPGDTVYYRSATVSRFSLTDRDTLPVEFEILDPKSKPMPDSRLVGVTDHGVGNGSFRLPAALPPGVYALAARTWESAFSEERVSFDVLAPTSPQPQPATKPRPAEKPQSVVKPKADAKTAAGPSGPASPHVDFFPEGGRLAAGLENRVYFAARNGQGQPLEVRGSIVDGKGTSVAGVNAARDGLGVFSFVPDAADVYRLKIAGPSGEAPAGAGEFPRLPPASAEQKIAIDAGRGVIAAGAPLELLIRAGKDRLALVVAVRLRGMLVRQQMIITPSSNQSATASAVVIPLDEQIAGVIRVTVYDYANSPPKAIAERLVYRRPKRLVVHAEEGKKPGDDLSLVVQDEKGRPVAAAVGLTALGGELTNASRPGWPAVDLVNALTSDDGAEDLAGLDCVRSNAATAAPDHAGPGNAPATLLELTLGCQRLNGTDKPDEAPPSMQEQDLPAPLVFDNLSELRTQYEAALSEYRAKGTRVLNALIMLSFFDGLALTLFVSMLALLRIVGGSRLWWPAAIAMISCVVVTGVSNEPSRMKAVEAAAVAFTPTALVADVRPNAPISKAPAKPEPERSDSVLRNLAVKLLAGEDSEAVKAARFPVLHYVQPGPCAASGADGVKPLAWYPLLISDAAGRVTLQGFSPDGGQPVRLFIDAQGDGRIESCELLAK
jgi:hypothetical protein